MVRKLECQSGFNFQLQSLPRSCLNLSISAEVGDFTLADRTFNPKIVIDLAVVFFLICFGLGYPILNRYDPGMVPGASDAAGYADAVRSPMSIAAYRIFVPALAKPFYWLANGRVATWDPARFGLLVATSILTASTAVAIVAIGLRCGLAYGTSLLGAMLFLVNFAVPELESGRLCRFR